MVFIIQSTMNDRDNTNSSHLQGLDATITKAQQEIYINMSRLLQAFPGV